MDSDWRESDLSPEMFNHTNCATGLTPQAKQANEHNEK
jgi:hypothetical protein